MLDDDHSLFVLRIALVSFYICSLLLNELCNLLDALFMHILHQNYSEILSFVDVNDAADIGLLILNELKLCYKKYLAEDVFSVHLRAIV